MSTDQPSLFGMHADELKPPPPRSSRLTPPARGRRTNRSRAGHPAVVTEVLTELEHGMYGLLDDTDTVVIFEEHEHVRAALDDDAIHHLMSQGYAESCPPRERVSYHHGAIRKPVLPLRLTKRGRTLLTRWSALQPLNESRR